MADRRKLYWEFTEDSFANVLGAGQVALVAKATGQEAIHAWTNARGRIVLFVTADHQHLWWDRGGARKSFRALGRKVGEFYNGNRHFPHCEEIFGAAEGAPDFDKIAAWQATGRMEPELIRP